MFRYKYPHYNFTLIKIKHSNLQNSKASCKAWRTFLASAAFRSRSVRIGRWLKIIDCYLQCCHPRVCEPWDLPWADRAAGPGLSTTQQQPVSLSSVQAPASQHHHWAIFVLTTTPTTAVQHHTQISEGGVHFIPLNKVQTFLVSFQIRIVQNFAEANYRSPPLKYYKTQSELEHILLVWYFIKDQDVYSPVLLIRSRCGHPLNISLFYLNGPISYGGMRANTETSRSSAGAWASTTMSVWELLVTVETET